MMPFKSSSYHRRKFNHHSVQKYITVRPIESSSYHRHEFEESDPHEFRDAICELCGNKVCFESSAYYCRECKSHFHKDCFTITYPKSHEHPLNYIRRKIEVPCDVCGGSNYGMIMYGCLLCDFFVHRDCIYSPKVIKITRHSHRLYHIFLNPDGENRCGICREQVDVRYGGYYCIEKTCKYFVHSYCIIYLNEWDGKDVEGEPEEEVDPEVDLALIEIDGRSIRHFSHEHDLIRLDVGEESGQVYCQACILPIEFGKFLGCKKCDFALHDACANLPRKIECALHIHPLHVDTMNIKDGFFTCSTCDQHSCGFMYKCCQEDCGFKIDLKCASFVEPFNHIAHPHPIETSIYDDKFFQRCFGCQRDSRFVGRCNWTSIVSNMRETCYYFLEFKCLNLPSLVKYKYDIHPLTLFSNRANYKRGVKTSLDCWCEICEENINKYKLFYTCDDCCTTLHVDCILGKYPYLKPGHKIKVNGFEVEIALNNGRRQICHTCHSICLDKQIFNGKDDVYFCSFKCIHSTK